MRRNTTAELGLLLVALVVCLAGVTTASAALVFSNPLDYDTVGVVGTRDGGGSASEAQIAIYAQDILNATPSSLPSGITLSTLPGVDYSGTIVPTVFYKKDLPDGEEGEKQVREHPEDWLVIPKGWEYVAAKYDGPNAGIVLFYLGGLEATIPQYPYVLWTTDKEKWALSQWVAFNKVEPGPVVPEPTTILAGALLLLPCGASVIRALRRNQA